MYEDPEMFKRPKPSDELLAGRKFVLKYLPELDRFFQKMSFNASKNFSDDILVELKEIYKKRTAQKSPTEEELNGFIDAMNERASALKEIAETLHYCKGILLEEKERPYLPRLNTGSVKYNFTELNIVYTDDAIDIAKTLKKEFVPENFDDYKFHQLSDKFSFTMLCKYGYTELLTKYIEQRLNPYSYALPDGLLEACKNYQYTIADKLHDLIKDNTKKHSIYLHLFTNGFNLGRLDMMVYAFKNAEKYNTNDYDLIDDFVKYRKYKRIVRDLETSDNHAECLRFLFQIITPEQQKQFFSSQSLKKTVMQGNTRLVKLLLEYLPEGWEKDEKTVDDFVEAYFSNEIVDNHEIREAFDKNIHSADLFVTFFKNASDHPKTDFSHLWSLAPKNDRKAVIKKFIEEIKTSNPNDWYAYLPVALDTNIEIVKACFTEMNEEDLQAAIKSHVKTVLLETSNIFSFFHGRADHKVLGHIKYNYEQHLKNWIKETSEHFLTKDLNDIKQHIDEILTPNLTLILGEHGAQKRADELWTEIQVAGFLHLFTCKDSHYNKWHNINWFDILDKCKALWESFSEETRDIVLAKLDLKAVEDIEPLEKETLEGIKSGEQSGFLLQITGQYDTEPSTPTEEEKEARKAVRELAKQLDTYYSDGYRENFVPHFTDKAKDEISTLFNIQAGRILSDDEISSRFDALTERFNKCQKLSRILFNLFVDGVIKNPNPNAPTLHVDGRKCRTTINPNFKYEYVDDQIDLSGTVQNLTTSYRKKQSSGTLIIGDMCELKNKRFIYKSLQNANLDDNATEMIVSATEFFQYDIADFIAQRTDKKYHQTVFSKVFAKGVYNGFLQTLHYAWAQLDNENKATCIETITTNASDNFQDSEIRNAIFKNASEVLQFIFDHASAEQALKLARSDALYFSVLANHDRCGSLILDHYPEAWEFDDNLMSNFVQSFNTACDKKNIKILTRMISMVSDELAVSLCLEAIGQNRYSPTHLLLQRLQDPATRKLLIQHQGYFIFKSAVERGDAEAIATIWKQADDEDKGSMLAWLLQTDLTLDKDIYLPTIEEIVKIIPAELLQDKVIMGLKSAFSNSHATFQYLWAIADDKSKETILNDIPDLLNALVDNKHNLAQTLKLFELKQKIDQHIMPTLEMLYGEEKARELYASSNLDDETVLSTLIHEGFEAAWPLLKNDEDTVIETFLLLLQRDKDWFNTRHLCEKIWHSIDDDTRIRIKRKSEKIEAITTGPHRTTLELFSGADYKETPKPTLQQIVAHRLIRENAKELYALSGFNVQEKKFNDDAIHAVRKEIRYWTGLLDMTDDEFAIFRQALEKDMDALCSIANILLRYDNAVFNEQIARSILPAIQKIDENTHRINLNLNNLSVIYSNNEVDVAKTLRHYLIPEKNTDEYASVLQIFHVFQIACEQGYFEWIEDVYRRQPNFLNQDRYLTGILTSARGHHYDITDFLISNGHDAWKNQALTMLFESALINARVDMAKYAWNKLDNNEQKELLKNEIEKLANKELNIKDNVIIKTVKQGGVEVIEFIMDAASPEQLIALLESELLKEAVENNQRLIVEAILSRLPDNWEENEKIKDVFSRAYNLSNVNEFIQRELERRMSNDLVKEFHAKGISPLVEGQKASSIEAEVKSEADDDAQDNTIASESSEEEVQISTEVEEISNESGIETSKTDNNLLSSLSQHKEIKRYIEALEKYITDLPSRGSARYLARGQAKQEKFTEILKSALNSDEDSVTKLINATTEILQDRKNNPLLVNRGTHAYFWKSALKTKLQNPFDHHYSRSTTEDLAIRLYTALKYKYGNDDKYEDLFTAEPPTDDSSLDL